jgi:glutathione S-transferase
MMMDWIDRSKEVDFNLIMKKLSRAELNDAQAFEDDISSLRLRDLRGKAREFFGHKVLGPIYKEKLMSVEREAVRHKDRRLVKKHYRKLQRLVDDMEKDLQNSQYLAGRDFSLADVLWIPILYRLEELNLTVDLFGDGRHPRLAAYYTRCKQRDSFHTAILQQMENNIKHTHARATCEIM